MFFSASFCLGHLISCFSVRHRLQRFEVGLYYLYIPFIFQYICGSNCFVLSSLMTDQQFLKKKFAQKIKKKKKKKTFQKMLKGKGLDELISSSYQDNQQVENKKQQQFLFKKQKLFGNAIFSTDRYIYIKEHQTN